MKTFIFLQKFIHIMTFPPKNDFQRQVKFGGTPGIKNIPKQDANALLIQWDFHDLKVMKAKIATEPSVTQMCILHKEIAWNEI